MTTPAMSPVDPPGECEVVNQDQDGAVIPAAGDGSSRVRPQIASTRMIAYSPATIQPWNLIVVFTPITAMATTIRQITVATTQVSGLSFIWEGATSDSTVEPISVMLPMLEVSAVISTKMPTPNPMIGESPRATQCTGAHALACQALSRW